MFIYLFYFCSCTAVSIFSTLLPPPRPPPTLNPSPLWLSPWVLYTCSLMTLSLLSPIIYFLKNNNNKGQGPNSIRENNPEMAGICSSRCLPSVWNANGEFVGKRKILPTSYRHLFGIKANMFCSSWMCFITEESQNSGILCWQHLKTTLIQWEFMSLSQIHSDRVGTNVPDVFIMSPVFSIGLDLT